jgi:septum formation inhibitor-activating ATPase MinD
MGTIINKKRKKRYELSNKDIEQTLKMKIIAEIPEDQKILQAARKFCPTPWKYKRAKSSKAYNKLAGTIIKDEKYEH